MKIRAADATTDLTPYGYITCFKHSAELCTGNIRRVCGAYLWDAQGVKVMKIAPSGSPSYVSIAIRLHTRGSD